MGLVVLCLHDWNDDEYPILPTPCPLSVNMSTVLTGPSGDVTSVRTDADADVFMCMMTYTDGVK